jgi:HEAT repeat protein
MSEPGSDAPTVADRVRLLLIPTDDGEGWRRSVHALKAAEAIPVVADVLADAGEPAAARRQAALLLGELGDRRGIAPLAGALADGDPVVRARALEALARFHDLEPDLLRAVVDRLADEDGYVREIAARACAELRPPSADQALREMATTDPVPQARAAAQAAIEAMEGAD